VKKRFLLALSMCILVAAYLLQRFSYADALNGILPGVLQISHPHAVFVVNKTIRLVLNDIACILLIHAFFRSKPHLTIAFYLFLIELLIILPLYFFIKLSMEGDSEISSPLLSHIHRLIVNPLLMVLLVIGFLIQRLKQEKS
jgi:exosortase F-associated protein